MDHTSASATLTAAIEPRTGNPILKAGRLAVNVVGAVLFGPADTFLADTDLVVRRRATNEIVLQTAADVGDPERLLDEANKDLDELSEQEFLVAWSAPRT